MYPISELFTEYLAERSREWLVKVVIDDVEYGSNRIVDFVIENNLSASDEFTLGTTVISKLTLQLKTTDEIAPNAKVIPYVALQLPPAMDGANVAWQDADVAWQDADFPWQGNVTEWLPLGEFYVDNRTQQKDVWTFECLDKLVFAAVPHVSALSYPATMQAVWDEICDSLGYAYDNTVVIDPTYTIPAGPAGFTKLQVLGYIAAANAACVYVAKDGTLRFRRFSASDQPVVEIPSSEYIRVKQTNPVKTYTRIVAVYDDDGSAYEAGSGDENVTLYIELPWATQAIVNALYTRLNGFSYVPIEMDARGMPQLELGDRFRFGQKAAEYDLTWATADVAWQDADWTWDGYEGGGGISIALNQTYRFRGGLKMTIDAPSISEQESEFEVDGTLTGQINRLNQSAVELGRAYYGLTVTREAGLTIQREDGLSELTLNSDVMDWKVNGVSTLYYDALDNELKFTGHLLAATGTFAGELQAATGTFTGELVAASGTFTGQLQAATGSFSGQITATSGTIGGWTIEADRLSGGGILQGGQLIGPNVTTGTSYPRIELNSTSQLLIAASDALNRIEFQASNGGAPTIEIYGGGSVQALLNYSNLFDDLLLHVNGALELSANTINIPSWSQLFSHADGQTLAQALNNLAAALSAKATAGISTGSAGAHNHGIPPGTQLMVAGGGTVTWVAAPDHSHIQNS